MHLEKSTVLAKKSNLVNVGTKETPQITLYVEPLLDEEKTNSVALLKERNKKIAWSYTDMPRLDHEVIVQNLAVYPKAKPVKQKLRKMHP